MIASPRAVLSTQGHPVARPGKNARNRKDRPDAIADCSPGGRTDPGPEPDAVGCPALPELQGDAVAGAGAADLPALRQGVPNRLGNPRPADLRRPLDPFAG